MSIDANEVRRVARLAELAVTEDELPALAAQMNRIVGYVAQLEDLNDDGAGALRSGPPALRLREDVVAPWPMMRGPEANAPEFRDGFFLVPRRDTGGGDDAAGDGA